MKVYVVTALDHSGNFPELNVKVFNREADAREFENILWLTTNANGSEVYSKVEVHERIVL